MDEKKQEILQSILSSVKKYIGIEEEDEAFDIDIIMNINSAIYTLYQIGVIEKPYTITSKYDTYLDLISDGREGIINEVKMYLSYKVKLGFDSSTLSGTVIEVLKESIRESIWRLAASSNSKDIFE